MRFSMALNCAEALRGYGGSSGCASMEDSYRSYGICMPALGDTLRRPVSCERPVEAPFQDFLNAWP